MNRIKISFFVYYSENRKLILKSKLPVYRDRYNSVHLGRKPADLFSYWHKFQQTDLSLGRSNTCVFQIGFTFSLSGGCNSRPPGRILSNKGTRSSRQKPDSH